MGKWMARKKRMYATSAQDDTLRVPEGWVWRQFGSMHMCSHPDANVHGSVVHAFDLDSTLITTKNGRMPRKWDDVVPVFDCVASKLQELHEQGVVIVVMSNQAGVSMGYVTLNFMKMRFQCVMQTLGVPMHVCFASKKDSYRKPKTRMWTDFTAQIAPSAAAEESVYVGDAAGRATDHSCCDREFAFYANLRFYTPEEYFLDTEETAEWQWETVR